MRSKEFNKLKKILKGNGYKVKVLKSNKRLRRYQKRYRFYYVTGKGIFGAFCTKSNGVHYRLKERFVVDNENSFDKWQDCPLVVKVPVKDIPELLRQLEHLGGEEGNATSNSYSFYNFNPYFYEIEK